MALCREVWLEAAKRVFQDIDGSSSGRFRSGNLLRALRAKLPEPEINYALEDALIELGYAGAPVHFCAGPSLHFSGSNNFSGFLFSGMQASCFGEVLERQISKSRVVCPAGITLHSRLVLC